MRVVVSICFVCLLSSIAGAQVAAPVTDISRPYSITLGQMYALSMQQTFAAFMKNGDWDAPVLVAYDAEDKRVQIDILGGRTAIDDAKNSVEEFRAKILSPSLIYLNEVLHKNLDESAIRICYTNRQIGKMLLKFENGTYTLQ